MIYLYYQNYKIGQLEYVNGEFIYNSLKDEKEALKNCVGLFNYNLTNSKNLKQTKLFDFFVNTFINEIKDRKDILEKITVKDLNYYDILEKLGKMNLDKFKYWLSLD